MLICPGEDQMVNCSETVENEMFLSSQWAGADGSNLPGKPDSSVRGPHQ